MGENTVFDQLVTQARRGVQQSMNELAQTAEPRLRAYLYRTTLDEELTGDLVQEAMLEMVRSLKDLQKVQSFWPWLYRIASNKANEVFQRRKRASVAQFSALEDSLLERILGDDSQEAVGSLVRRELGQLVFKAAAKLKHQQRAVLSLRCFEGFSYAQIAQAVGCSETEARVSFFRARQSLKRQLTRRGFSKSSLLLALIFFGKLTASSEAAATGTTVTAAVLKGIGLRATLLGIAKAGGMKISIAAAGSLLIAVAGWHFWPESILNRADVRSVHFFVQDAWAGPDSASSSSSSSWRGPAGLRTDAPPLKTHSFYETWLYLPEGPDGPVLRREQRWGNMEKTERQCSWLQDGKANYYYHAGKEVVYATNDPLGALLLPTDPPDIAEFILAMCSRHPALEYIRDERSGLLTGRIDNRVPAVKDFKTAYEYDTLDAEFFEYGWPEETKVVDQRDTMHKRGWTYFRVAGRIGDRTISGQGRMPFVYATHEEYYPWLRLEVADGLSIVDGCYGAYLVDGSGAAVARYPAGSFFRGLGRPWTGIRAYDTVRRDAAEKRIEFEYERIAEGGWVTLRRDDNYSHARINYFIDMEKDVIENIGFSISGGPEPVEGTLEFTYLDDISQVGGEFVEPGPIDSELPAKSSIGVFWLLRLADGSLGKV
jgi:RNA polymerase sigma-70 factor (ECF subfamily)